VVVKQLAAKGEGGAQFSWGCVLLKNADGGAAGRSAKADVGLKLCSAQFPFAHQAEASGCVDLMIKWSTCVCKPSAEEAKALLEKAAGQGHVYAAEVLHDIHVAREEYEQAVKWATKGAEAGLPKAMFDLGCHLDKGEGVAAPDILAAVDWYRGAADAGDSGAAITLCRMYTIGRGEPDR